MHFEATAPLLSLYIAWEADRSRLPLGDGGGDRSDATALGSSLFTVHDKIMYWRLKWTLESNLGS